MGGERGPERVLLGVVERSADDRPSDAFKVFEHLVGRHLPDQQEEASLAGLQRLIRLPLQVLSLMPTSVSAPPSAPPAAPTRCAYHWQQEEPADQHAPQRAGSAPLAIGCS